MSSKHRDCDGPTERGVCLWHMIGPYVAHCEAGCDEWPCEVLRLREKVTILESKLLPTKMAPFGGE